MANNPLDALVEEDSQAGDLARETVQHPPSNPHESSGEYAQEMGQREHQETEHKKADLDQRNIAYYEDPSTLAPVILRDPRDEKTPLRRYDKSGLVYGEDGKQLGVKWPEQGSPEVVDPFAGLPDGSQKPLLSGTRRGTPWQVAAQQPQSNEAEEIQNNETAKYITNFAKQSGGLLKATDAQYAADKSAIGTEQDELDELQKRTLPQLQSSTKPNLFKGFFQNGDEPEYQEAQQKFEEASKRAQELQGSITQRQQRIQENEAKLEQMRQQDAEAQRLSQQVQETQLAGVRKRLTDAGLLSAPQADTKTDPVRYQELLGQHDEQTANTMHAQEKQFQQQTAPDSDLWQQPAATRPAVQYPQSVVTEKKVDVPDAKGNVTQTPAKDLDEKAFLTRIVGEAKGTSDNAVDVANKALDEAAQQGITHVGGVPIQQLKGETQKKASTQDAFGTNAASVTQATADSMTSPQIETQAGQIRQQYLDGKMSKEAAMRQLASITSGGQSDKNWIDEIGHTAYQTAKSGSSVAAGLASAAPAAELGAGVGTAVAGPVGGFVGGSVMGMAGFAAGSGITNKIVGALDKYLSGVSDTYKAGSEEANKDEMSKAVGDFIPTVAMALESGGGYLALSKVEPLKQIFAKAALSAVGMELGMGAVTGATEGRMLTPEEIKENALMGALFGGSGAQKEAKVLGGSMGSSEHYEKAMQNYEDLLNISSGKMTLPEYNAKYGADLKTQAHVVGAMNDLEQVLTMGVHKLSGITPEATRTIAQKMGLSDEQAKAASEFSKEPSTTSGLVLLGRRAREAGVVQLPHDVGEGIEHPQASDFRRQAVVDHAAGASIMSGAAADLVQGKPIDPKMQEFLTKMGWVSEHEEPALDPQGQPILDKAGNQVTQPVQKLNAGVVPYLPKELRTRIANIATKNPHKLDQVFKLDLNGNSDVGKKANAEGQRILFGEAKSLAEHNARTKAKIDSEFKAKQQAEAEAKAKADADKKAEEEAAAKKKADDEAEAKKISESEEPKPPVPKKTDEEISTSGSETTSKVKIIGKEHKPLMEGKAHIVSSAMMGAEKGTAFTHSTDRFASHADIMKEHPEAAIKDQHGFIDDRVHYLTRLQAAAEAAASGQISRETYEKAMAREGDEAGLHSEDLREGEKVSAPIDEAAAETEKYPSAKQRKAGNYVKGRESIGGMGIAVENAAGSERSGTDESGKKWTTRIHDHYGYLEGTKGSDGEAIDVFVKEGTPSDWSGDVFIVNQQDAEGRHDEHKVIFGAKDEAEAREIYHRNFEDGWKGMDSIATMPLDEFKKWAYDEKADKSGKAESFVPEVEKDAETPEQKAARIAKEKADAQIDADREKLSDMVVASVKRSINGLARLGFTGENIKAVQMEEGASGLQAVPIYKGGKIDSVRIEYDPQILYNHFKDGAVTDQQGWLNKAMSEEMFHAADLMVSGTRDEFENGHSAIWEELRQMYPEQAEDIAAAYRNNADTDKGITINPVAMGAEFQRMLWHINTGDKKIAEQFHATPKLKDKFEKMLSFLRSVQMGDMSKRENQISDSPALRLAIDHLQRVNDFLNPPMTDEQRKAADEWKERINNHLEGRDTDAALKEFAKLPERLSDDERNEIEDKIKAAVAKKKTELPPTIVESSPTKKPIVLKPHGVSEESAAEALKSPAFSGTKSGVFTMDDGTQIPYTYQLVDGRLVVNNPDNERPDETHDDTKKFIAANSGEKYNAAKAFIADPDFEKGTTIAFKHEGRYVLLGGHRRTFLYRANEAKYNSALPDALDQYGLPKFAADQLEHPYVVAVVDRNISAEEHSRLIRQLNSTDKQETNPIFDAVSAGRQLSKESIKTAGYLFDTDGDKTPLALLTSASAKELSDAFLKDGAIRKQDRQKYVNDNGSFTDEGARFARTALLGQVIDDPKTLEWLQGSDAEKKLINGLSGLYTLSKRGQDMKVFTEMLGLEASRITEGIASVKDYQALLDSDFLIQDSRNFEAEALQRWFGSFSARDAKKRFNALVGEFRAHGEDGQQDAFAPANRDVAKGLIEYEKKGTPLPASKPEKGEKNPDSENARLSLTWSLLKEKELKGAKLSPDEHDRMADIERELGQQFIFNPADTGARGEKLPPTPANLLREQLSKMASEKGANKQVIEKAVEHLKFGEFYDAEKVLRAAKMYREADAVRDEILPRPKPTPIEERQMSLFAGKPEKGKDNQIDLFNLPKDRKYKWQEIKGEDTPHWIAQSSIGKFHIVEATGRDGQKEYRIANEMNDGQTATYPAQKTLESAQDFIEKRFDTLSGSGDDVKRGKSTLIQSNAALVRQTDLRFNAGNGNRTAKPPPIVILDGRSAFTQRSPVDYLDERIKSILRPHQVQGVNLVLNAFANGDHFLLADGTGAGKSMQQIAVAAMRAQPVARWEKWTRSDAEAKLKNKYGENWKNGANPSEVEWYRKIAKGETEGTPVLGMNNSDTFLAKNGDTYIKFARHSMETHETGGEDALNTAKAGAEEAARANGELRGDRVLIVTQNAQIIYGSFSNDANRLGVQIYHYNGDTPEYGKIYMATYDDISRGLVKSDEWDTVSFDESQNLQNVMTGTKKAVQGDTLAQNAAHVMYASATPVDKIEQMYYLRKVLKCDFNDVMGTFGLQHEQKPQKDGSILHLFKHISGGPSETEREKLAENLYEELTRAGRMIKREVPLDNLDIKYREVPLPDEEYQHADDLYEMAAGRVQSPLFQHAVAANTVRGYLEQAKIKPVMEEVRKAMDERLDGTRRQVVIFAERIKDGETGKLTEGIDGTINKLVAAIEKEYGRNAVSKVYGGAGTNRVRDIERFQNGETRILVATGGSGGAGINLDDIYGDAPRTMIMMTPPMKAMDFVQIAGRINRLTTASRGELIAMFTDHPIDTWGMDISNKKLKLLGAVVKGELTAINPSAERTRELNDNDAARLIAKAWKSPRGEETDFKYAKEQLQNPETRQRMLDYAVDLDRQRYLAERASRNKNTMSPEKITEIASSASQFSALSEGHAHVEKALQEFIKDGALMTDHLKVIRAVMVQADENFLKNFKFEKIPKGTDRSVLGRGGFEMELNPESGKMEKRPLLKLKEDAVRPSAKKAFQGIPDMGKVFLHEYGHAGYFCLLTQREKRIVNRAYAQVGGKGSVAEWFRQPYLNVTPEEDALVRELNRKEKKEPLTPEEMEKRSEILTAKSKARLSNHDYYAKNVYEFFAEGFAKHVLEKRVPDTVLGKVYDSIGRYFLRVVNALRRRSDMNQLTEVYDRILGVSVQKGTYGIDYSQPVRESLDTIPKPPFEPRVFAPKWGGNIDVKGEPIKDTPINDLLKTRFKDVPIQVQDAYQENAKYIVHQKDGKWNVTTLVDNKPVKRPEIVDTHAEAVDRALSLGEGQSGDVSVRQGNKFVPVKDLIESPEQAEQRGAALGSSKPEDLRGYLDHQSKWLLGKAHSLGYKGDSAVNDYLKADPDRARRDMERYREQRGEGVRASKPEIGTMSRDEWEQDPRSKVLPAGLKHIDEFDKTNFSNPTDVARLGKMPWERARWIGESYGWRSVRKGNFAQDLADRKEVLDFGRQPDFEEKLRSLPNAEMKEMGKKAGLSMGYGNRENRERQIMAWIDGSEQAHQKWVSHAAAMKLMIGDLEAGHPVSKELAQFAQLSDAAKKSFGYEEKGDQIVKTGDTGRYKIGQTSYSRAELEDRLEGLKQREAATILENAALRKEHADLLAENNGQEIDGKKLEEYQTFDRNLSALEGDLEKAKKDHVKEYLAERIAELKKDYEAAKAEIEPVIERIGLKKAERLAFIGSDSFFKNRDGFVDRQRESQQEIEEKLKGEPDFQSTPKRETQDDDGQMRLLASKPELSADEKRLNALKLIESKRPLNLDEQKEREDLERNIGQGFFDITPNQEAHQIEDTRTAKEKAEAKAKIDRTGKVTDAAKASDAKGNMTLFSSRPEKSTDLQDSVRSRAAREIGSDEHDAAIGERLPIKPAGDTRPPSDEEMASALNVAQRPKIGAARNLPDGTKVGLRLDIPAYYNHGKYVVTIHEANGKSVGKVIGYDGMAHIRNPEFLSNEKTALKIGSGESSKVPMATINGELVKSREIPTDLHDSKVWTQAGFNPARHSYYYDRLTGDRIVGGKEAIITGGTAYIKDAKLGDKETALFASKPEDVEKGVLDHRGIITQVGLRAGIKRENIEDFYNDVVLKALRASGQFDPEKGTIQNWIGQIARREAAEQYRSAHAMMRDTDKTESLNEPVGGGEEGDEGAASRIDYVENDPSESTIPETVIQHDLVDQLRGEVAKLPKEDQQLIRDIGQGKGWAEIAEERGLSRQAWQQKAQKIFDKLRSALADGDIGQEHEREAVIDRMADRSEQPLEGLVNGINETREQQDLAMQIPEAQAPEKARAAKLLSEKLQNKEGDYQMRLLASNPKGEWKPENGDRVKLAINGKLGVIGSVRGKTAEVHLDEGGITAAPIKTLTPLRNESPEREMERNVAAIKSEYRRKVSVAAELARSTNAGKRLWERAAAASDKASMTLADFFLHQRQVTDYIKAKGEWLGAGGQDTDVSGRQQANHEARQMEKAINAKFSPDSQRAITRFIQADGDLELLNAQALSSDKDLRGIYVKAANLTPEEKQLAERVKDFFQSKAEVGQRYGLLGDLLDNYVNQLWDLSDKKNQQGRDVSLGHLATSRLNTRFDNAMKRVFESYFAGEQAGYKAKTTEIGKLMSVYAQSFNHVVADRTFVRNLTDLKASDGRPLAVVSGYARKVEGKVADALKVSANNKPNDAGDYQHIEHPALRKWKWVDTDENGKSTTVEGNMLVHPEIYKDLRNTLGKSALQNVPIIRGITEIQAAVKQTLLSMSMFHAVQEGLHSVGHGVNPFKPDQIDFNNPLHRDLVNHGLMLSDYDARRAFSEGVGSAGGLLGKVPFLGHYLEESNSWLFEDYIPRLKVTMATHAFERNMQRYPSLSREQILEKTAKQANDAFGEQNYRYMGRNQTFQHVLRLGLLAPDFLESRGKFMADAFTRYGGEQRRALVVLSAAMFVMAKSIEKMLSGTNDFSPEHAFSVMYKNREYKMRSVIGDVVELMSDPRRFVSGRLSPLIGRSSLEFLSGRDYRGEKRDLTDQLGDLLKASIPISLKGLADTAAQKMGFNPSTDIGSGGQVLNSLGVQTKRASIINEAASLGAKWQEKKGLVASEEVRPPSKYAPLRHALEDGNMVEARNQYLKLAQESGSEAVEKGMLLSLQRPFSGSDSTEREFQRSLTDEELQKVKDADRERRGLVSKFVALAKVSGAVKGKNPPVTHVAGARNRSNRVTYATAFKGFQTAL